MLSSRPESRQEDLNSFGLKFCFNGNNDGIKYSLSYGYVFLHLATKAQKKFQLISNSLSSINDIELDIHIGISNCYIDGNFDAEEAEKRCYAALEAATDENKTVIYAE